MAALLLLASLLPLAGAAHASAQPDTIFANGTPATVDSGDGRAVELGVKFSSEVAGTVTGIRFYKGSTNTGTHIGSLWTAGGTLLASATFTNETASGWQQVNFATPAPISANTTYVAGYFAPRGHYSYTSSGLSSALSSPPLTALANSTAPNGVYAYSPTSVFPTGSYKATNYWVDVDFEPEPATAPGQPTNVAASAGPGSAAATVSWNAPASGGAPAHYLITPYVGSTAQPGMAVTAAPSASSATITGLTNGTAYTFTVQALNSAGSGPLSAQSNAATPVAQDTIFGDDTPTTVDSGDGRAAELGVKFSSEVAGRVSGIRFYKASANTGTHIGSLWTAGGTLLASATFTNETASGWQQVNFATPVAISANTTYVAGYLAPQGHYSDTPSGLSSALSSAPLTALASSTTPNGVYAYSPTSVLPTHSYKATNYWVDVNFEPEAVTAPPPKEPPAGSIAYPDLQLLMPTSEIYVQSSGATRTLEFTHTTWDAGEGPWEVNPTYNSTTGISQGYQTLYTMPKPGEWKVAGTVPVVGPMLWRPPSDYNFPLDKFWLYNSSGPGGSAGSIVATSPKTEFCMTADTDVGGVANTPSFNAYYVADCEKPEGKLGLDVGWGDTYDAYDGGEGIEISSLPNGIYWLRGEVDPEDYFLESNKANNITETKLQIEGNNVKVLEQINPSSTPPTVALTGPGAESKLSGTVSLSATASGPAPISSVQFLLDGEPIGSPVTSAPYTLQWPSGSTPAGHHFLSAQATDTRGLVGTAADVPVTIEGGSGGGPTSEPPVVSLVNPVSGQLLSGTVQVSANVTGKLPISSVQFYLDGNAIGAPVSTAPYATSLETATLSNGAHKLTAVATDTAGNVGSSPPVEVTVQNPPAVGPCFVVDVETSATGHGATTTGPFTTAEGGEELLAFVSSDGPAGAARQSATVSGAGLEWKLVARANSRSGDAEIWAARASAPLVGATITSTPAASGYDQTLTVISVEMSLGIGASVTSGGASGAPSVSLTTTEEGSVVYAVGNDWDTATARTLGSNQVMLHQYLDTKTGDTFWSQYTGYVTGLAGSPITLNDTAPTSDQWNMAAVEVLGDGPGV